MHPLTSKPPTGHKAKQIGYYSGKYIPAGTKPNDAGKVRVWVAELNCHMLMLPGADLQDRIACRVKSILDARVFNGKKIN